MKFSAKIFSAKTAIFTVISVLAAGLFLFACTQLNKGNEVGKAQTANHLKMIENLAQTYKKLNRPENGYASEVKLADLESKIAATKDINQKLNLTMNKGFVYLELGREQESVALFEQIVNYVKTVPLSYRIARSALALAYLRLAERTNCVMQHSSEACIMPIQGNGIHQDKLPARHAAALFEALLKEYPDDLDARWLLNICYMQLGEYPNKVPKQWLIAGLDAKGKTQVKPFSDIAGDLGLDVNNRAGGAIVEDFNNDGYLDIVTSAWGLDDPMKFFLNNADGTFTDASQKSGLAAFTGGLNCVQTDYNNDGWVDIFVLRGAWQGVQGFGEQPNSLLRNNTDGTFTDVTIDAGLLSYRPTQTATWNDFNNDGWLDLFIGNECNVVDNFPCEFYINNQDGTFTNIASEQNLNIKTFVKGVVSGDYDNDGWADIFISSMEGKKILLRNRGIAGKIPEFQDVSAQAGFATETSRTFPTFFFDYDNDGWLDIFVCNYDFERPLSYYAAKEAIKASDNRIGKMNLYHNNHDGTFTNVATKMQVNQTIFAMGANFGDIDNDGWLDMYLATGNPNYQSLVPNRLYKNLGGKDYIEVTNSARVGHLQKGHGVSFADLNNNGDQDIYVEMGGAFAGDAYQSAFYLNPGQDNENNWICLKLEGTKSNRMAIGAKVTVKFRENGVERSVYREVNSGGSFGCSPFRREIGIGRAAAIDEILIDWPASGTKQVLKNIKPNQFIAVKEGQDGFKNVDLKTLVFKKRDGSIPMCKPLSK